MYRQIAHTKVIALLIAAVIVGLVLLPSFTSSAEVTDSSKQAPQDPVSAAGLGPQLVPANIYRQTNLVSDIPNLAQIIDPSLVNPWGISMSATSPFWVANNGTSTATLYGGDIGAAPATKNPLVVTIPGILPTGTVFNGSSDFVITAGGGIGPARFIFVSITGNVLAWRAGNAAIAMVVNPGHVYTGLAIGNNGAANFLYAADFAHAQIDVYNGTFGPATLAGSFTDPALPAGYSPFNIQNIGGKLYVMYAKVNPMTGEEDAGPGNGLVSVFDANGNFLQRLISNGTLNAPWGIALAPAGFGAFGSALLVGNFGDGKINAFDPTTGAPLGTLNDQSGHEIEIEGLWALSFGNGVGGGDTANLYFNAGIGDEEHGIFGRIQTAATPGIAFQFSATEYTADEGAGFATVTVNRTGDANQPASVNFATVPESSAGHASPVNDFIQAGGTLRFAPGEVAKTFRVLIIDDHRVEGDELVDVYLSNATGAALGFPNKAEVKITDNDSPAVSPAPKTFVASLDGAHEVPAHVTNGTGTGVVIVTDETTGAAKVSLDFNGLTTPANAAHIHGPAAEGVNAPILFPITVPAAVKGSVNNFNIAMTPTQLQQLKDGLFYFNIHTTDFPNGEIRGQIKFNPIDEPGFFVREQYLDFLNRNPDTSGLDFWTGQITSCGGADSICISNRRIDVSAAFFQAQEFQTRGLFVYEIRKASYGVLPRLSQFTFDRSLVGTGSDADRKTFTEGFVQNGEFLGVYPTTMTASDYVDKLVATVLTGSGVDLSSKKTDLINEYGMEASQAASRARVLRRLVGYPEFTNVEFNRGFVAAEYYGYLRRTPDTSGFNFWLGVLNANANNYRSMVCSFITSAEYQARFGASITRGNTECATVAP